MILLQRYKDTGMTQMQIQRVARAVFLHIDDDASGGIAFQEFIDSLVNVQRFCSCRIVYI